MQEYRQTSHLSSATKAIDTLLYVVTASVMLLFSVSFLGWLCF